MVDERIPKIDTKIKEVSELPRTRKNLLWLISVFLTRIRIILRYVPDEYTPRELLGRLTLERKDEIRLRDIYLQALATAKGIDYICEECGFTKRRYPSVEIPQADRNWVFDEITPIILAIPTSVLAA